MDFGYFQFHLAHFLVRLTLCDLNTSLVGLMLAEGRNPIFSFQKYNSDVSQFYRHHKLRHMYKVHSTGFWAREPKKVKRARFLASMKEIVKMCNQAPNADIFFL